MAFLILSQPFVNLAQKPDEGMGVGKEEGPEDKEAKAGLDPLDDSYLLYLFGILALNTFFGGMDQKPRKSNLGVGMAPLTGYPSILFFPQREHGMGSMAIGAVSRRFVTQEGCSFPMIILEIGSSCRGVAGAAHLRHPFAEVKARTSRGHIVGNMAVAARGRILFLSQQCLGMDALKISAVFLGMAPLAFLVVVKTGGRLVE